MYDCSSRAMAFLAVVLALLNAGFHFHHGNMTATLYFMACAIGLTAVTHLSVVRRII